MKKAPLLVAALAVLGAFAYVFIGKGEEPSDSSSKARDEAVTKDSISTGTGIASRKAPVLSDTAVPTKRHASTLSQGSTSPDTAATRYYREDGSEVRDHRKGAPPPDLTRTPTLPKSISKVQPETLVAVRKAIRPSMQQCIGDHKGEAEEDAKSQAVLTVSVEAETLTIDKVALSTTGVKDLEGFEACVQAAISGHSQVVEGSEDVAKHTMTFPYRF